VIHDAVNVVVMTVIVFFSLAVLMDPNLDKYSEGLVASSDRAHLLTVILMYMVGDTLWVLVQPSALPGAVGPILVTRT